MLPRMSKAMVVGDEGRARVVGSRSNAKYSIYFSIKETGISRSAQCLRENQPSAPQIYSHEFTMNTMPRNPEVICYTMSDPHKNYIPTKAKLIPILQRNTTILQKRTDPAQIDYSSRTQPMKWVDCLLTREIEALEPEESQNEALKDEGFRRGQEGKPELLKLADFHSTSAEPIKGED